jgi:predicted  nucleic acid-binding Zn-ribbon protein
MEKADALRTAHEAAVAGHAAAAAEDAAVLADAADRSETYGQQLAEHRQAWDEGCAALPPNIRSRFVKLAGSADGRAIVAVDRNSCGGCHFNIPADVLAGLGSFEVLNCPHCGKYLYIK